MTPSSPDWPQLLQLLDQALDIAPTARAAWLDALAPELHRLRPALQKLLDDRHAIETGGFMAGLPALQTAAADADFVDFTPGQHIGPYALQRELGRGGMACVWLAQRADLAHGRPVALKLPYVAGIAGARSRVIAERFVRERQILSALTHPHIASVLDAAVVPSRYGNGQLAPEVSPVTGAGKVGTVKSWLPTAGAPLFQ